jgi:hypothetical protein
MASPLLTVAQLILDALELVKLLRSGQSEAAERKAKAIAQALTIKNATRLAALAAKKAR